MVKLFIGIFYFAIKICFIRTLNHGSNWNAENNQTTKGTRCRK